MTSRYQRRRYSASSKTRNATLRLQKYGNVLLPIESIKSVLPVGKFLGILEQSFLNSKPSTMLSTRYL
jgi:F0F1-type ATP synthase assembly protein I